VIVLLTDFGSSEYVGVMKGVILTISPEARIVDLTHSISPQSVREAAWVLSKSYRYFPKHSVFACVVDPGVGTERQAVIVETPEYVFVGPDNGLLYPTLSEASSYDVYSLEPAPTASHTFHGRDVFAVAAARHHSGIAASNLGTPQPDLTVPLNFYLQNRTGEVVRVDHFGNIVTNLPPLKKKHLRIIAGSFRDEIDLCVTYTEGPNVGIFAIVGSGGTIELSAKNQRAIDYVSVKIGDHLTLE
jgi:S-adenosylmethionine hydrolase